MLLPLLTRCQREFITAMPNGITNTCRYASAYALCALLLCGCDANVERANTPSKSSDANVSEQRPDAQADEAKRFARMSELDANLTASQAKHDHLKLQQTRLTAQIDAHQTDSAATLARLKAELEARQKREAEKPTNDAGADPFSETARKQLEQALAMDQDYITQLNAVNGELEQLNQQMDAIHEELALLQTKQALPAKVTDADTSNPQQ